MTRLPTVGGDSGSWGTILNDFLLQSHNDDGTLKTQVIGAPQLKQNAVSSAALAPGAVSTNALQDGAVTSAKLSGAGQAGGVATLDGSGKLPASQSPDLASVYATYVSLAKNPDTLITGNVTLDGSNLLTSADVQWPDGTPGTFTVTSRDTNQAVLSYTVTYGSPATRTFTQPAMTRNASGVATAIPPMEVS